MPGLGILAETSNLHNQTSVCIIMHYKVQSIMFCIQGFECWRMGSQPAGSLATTWERKRATAW